ncbi:hypothetical protein ACSNOK_19830 [Streptomyces sp. URMC 126]|uniref:hypothetical protein n=1 Tax=Streptomyces sp. URMC 126 TaxID=3423401 RepID=UPI003F1BEE95
MTHIELSKLSTIKNYNEQQWNFSAWNKNHSKGEIIIWNATDSNLTLKYSRAWYEKTFFPGMAAFPPDVIKPNSGASIVAVQANSLQGIGATVRYATAGTHDQNSLYIRWDSWHGSGCHHWDVWWNPSGSTRLGMLDTRGREQSITSSRSDTSEQSPDEAITLGEFTDDSGPSPKDLPRDDESHPGTRKLFSSKQEKGFHHFGVDGSDHSPILFVVGKENVTWSVGDGFTQEDSCKFWKEYKSQVVHTKGFWKNGSAGAIFGAHLGAFIKRC